MTAMPSRGSRPTTTVRDGDGDGDGEVLVAAGAGEPVEPAGAPGGGAGG
ncbi:MAG: hypothetical protein JWQ48_2399, partial [Conexibacter sp.]|nr:hypothetical protein [Conexibacter sp.]